MPYNNSENIKCYENSPYIQGIESYRENMLLNQKINEIVAKSLSPRKTLKLLKNLKKQAWKSELAISHINYYIKYYSEKIHKRYYFVLRVLFVFSIPVGLIITTSNIQNNILKLEAIKKARQESNLNIYGSKLANTSLTRYPNNFIDSNPPATLDIEYKIKRESNTKYDSEERLIANCYFDKVIFSGDENIVEILNNKMDHLYEDFQSMEETLLDYASVGEMGNYDDFYYPYFCTHEFSSIYIGENFISISANEYWYAGGVTSLDTVAYNYSTNSGKEITLIDILNLSEQEIRKKIIDCTLKRTKEIGIPDSEINTSIIKSMPLSDISFYQDNSGLYVFFATGQISYDANGQINVPIE